jgi:hypothetical protein
MDFAFLVTVAVVTYNALHSVHNAINYQIQSENLFPIVYILRCEQASTSSRYLRWQYLEWDSCGDRVQQLRAERLVDVESGS